MILRGEIYWQSPHNEKVASKKEFNKDSILLGSRPVIVIQNDSLIRSGSVIVAKISSKIDRFSDNSCQVLSADKYGFKVDSCIMLNQIMTVPIVKLRDKIGSLDPEDTEILNSKIKNMMSV